MKPFVRRPRAVATVRPCPAGSAHHVDYASTPEGGVFHGVCRNCGWEHDVALWTRPTETMVMHRDADWQDRMWRALWARSAW